MTRRRDFLKVAGGAGALRSKAGAAPASHAALVQAREIVRAGKLGPIGYCRVAHSGLVTPARYVLDEEARNCVIEVEPAAPGTVFLGSRSTLVLTSRGFRVFTPGARSAP